MTTQQLDRNSWARLSGACQSILAAVLKLGPTMCVCSALTIISEAIPMVEMALFVLPLAVLRLAVFASFGSWLWMKDLKVEYPVASAKIQESIRELYSPTMNLSSSL